MVCEIHGLLLVPCSSYLIFFLFHRFLILYMISVLQNKGNKKETMFENVVQKKKKNDTNWYFAPMGEEKMTIFFQIPHRCTW